jgi:hypothetical protein
MVGIITQGNTDLPNGCIDPLRRIHKDIVAPETLDNLFQASEIGLRPTDPISVVVIFLTLISIK